MARVLICDHVDIEKLSLSPGIEVDYRPSITREELLTAVGGYEGLVVRSRTKVDREVIEKGARLRIVARPGTGLDNVDVGAAKAKGITVVNSPESLVEAVAEHVVLMMIGLSRKLVAADNSIKAGRWEKNALLGRELKGRVLGVVGFGRIGRRIAEVGRVLGMSVLAYDVIPLAPEVLSAAGARSASLDEVFSSSDFVTLHVPLTPETAHLVGPERLSTMKKGAVVVNTSRGGVVDEDALAAALEDGRLGGAALDVFEKEPPTGRILTAPNTILTPHIGGQTEEAQANAITVVGEKLNAFFRSSPP